MSSPPGDADDEADHHLPAKIIFTDEAREDLRMLDGSVRPRVLKDIMKLECEPHKRGGPLGSELTNLRKLYVGPRKGYRAVFAVRPDGLLSIVMVVAGRSEAECYEMARARIEVGAIANHRGFDEIAEQLRAVL